MTAFQIVMVAIMGLGFIAILGFSIAFIVEAVRGYNPEKANDKNDTTGMSVEEYDIRKMLAQLEEDSVENAKEQPVEEQPVEEVVPVEEAVEEPQPEVVSEPVVVETIKVEDILALLEEQSKEEPQAEEKEEVVEEQPEEVVAPVEETAEEVVEEPVKEDVVEEPQAEAKEEVVEDEDEEDYEDEEEIEEEKESPKTIIIERTTTETIGTDFDYNVRLAKIVESKNKMDKDLQKTKRAITKYERTQRRRTRNQKMLDRRAVELTNLNLMMYSVTDIKNIDADKKAKQEELTTHIAELKASIQDADAFLAKNREKYEHDKKMYAFYTKEEARYNDEIKELEILINSANSVTSSVTTTTTTETTEQ